MQCNAKINKIQHIHIMNEVSVIHGNIRDAMLVDEKLYKHWNE